MTRRFAFLALATTIGLVASAHAQQMAYRPVPRGEVSGLEMSLEGRLGVAPGAKLRFPLTLYEVVGQRDLRPSTHADVRVVASFKRDRPVARVRTDAYGRALVEIDVPGDLSEAFQLTFDARSPRRIRRRFDVSVALLPARRIELVADRTELPPRARVHVWGRALSTITSRPLAGATVHVALHGGDDETIVRTDPRGVFAATFRAPGEAGYSEATAWFSDRTVAEPEARLQIQTRVRLVPRLVIRAEARQQVVRPGTTVDVDISVRTARGRPLAGAVVEIEPRERLERPSVTDRRGRARARWRPTSRAAPSGDPVDVATTVRVVRAGVAAGETTFAVRVARSAHVLRTSVEGGTLALGPRSRIWIRAARADGQPVPAGTLVRFVSDRFGRFVARADSSGVAVIEGALAVEARGAAPDRCGGSTALAAEIDVEEASARTHEEVCLPVDPDATLQVRASPSIVTAARALSVTIERTSAVRALPVRVSLLELGDDSVASVAERILAPGARATTFTVPEGSTGPLLVRARPFLSATGQEVRGGSALVWREPSAAAVDLRVLGGDRIAIAARGARDSMPSATVFAAALPFAEGLALRDRLRALVRPLIQSAGDDTASDQLVSGALAERTPVDESVSAILRDGTVSPLPAPESAQAQGLLRDPWRGRARFVRGRLGLVIRALERYVESRVSESIEDVAVRGARGWQLNRELLHAITGAEELGAEGARGLDGSPLTITEIEALDPTFDFDHIARRITRKRLFAVLVALRKLVRDHDLDLMDRAPASPSAWLTKLEEASDEDGESLIEPEEIYDGWGRPFVIRRAGARRRAGLLTPIVGYEIVSAGPDGRAGTGDDVTDPFARVLPSRGAYAEAVGEDALLARLQGVELGRSAVAALSELFESESAGMDDEQTTRSENAARSPTFAALPPPPPLATADPLFERPGFVPTVASPPRTLAWPMTTARLALGEEPRRWLVVSRLASATGASAVATLAVRAGTPLLFDAELPDRLRGRERLTVPLAITALEPRDATVTLEVATRGPIDASFGGASRARVRVGGGRTVLVPMTLGASGNEPATGSIRVRVLDDRGRALRTIERRARIDVPGTLRLRVAASAVRATSALSLSRTDERDASTRLVLTPASALSRDPAARPMRETDPALLAWFEALASRSLDRDLADRLLDARVGGGVRGDQAWLSTACALVAWSAAPEDDARAQRARAEVAGQLATRGPDRYDDADEVTGRTRLRAAVLAALAAGASASPSPGQAAASDPVAAQVALLRRSLRASLIVHRTEPGILARAAAALLLADARDASGRAMLALARRGTRSAGGATLVVDQGAGVAPGDLAGTAALAIAAHQVGDTVLARSLADGLAPHIHLALSRGGEPAFWALAAAAYGAFGVDFAGAHRVLVERAAGSRQRLSIPSDRATVLRLHSPDVVVRRVGRVRSALLARIETRYVRTRSPASRGPIRAILRGDTGAAGEVSGYEIVVRNVGDRLVREPVVDVELPAGAAFGRGARPGTTRVEGPDARGLVRLHLQALRPGEERNVPLALRWIAAGSMRGLALVAYDLDRPFRIVTTPARTIRVGSPP